MSDIKVHMRLFGGFRKYGQEVVFSVPTGSTLETIKEKLLEVMTAEFENFTDIRLIDDSAVANDDKILGAGAVFNKDVELAILPPVCGG